MGVGVYVCMALEFYMAIAIASRMGFDISDDKFQDNLCVLSEKSIFRQNINTAPLHQKYKNSERK